MFRRVRHRNVGEPFLVYGENATIGWVFGRLGAAWRKNAGFRLKPEAHEARTSFSVLAARAPELCLEDVRLPIRGRREDRVRAAPAVSCANSHKQNAHEHTGSAETLRPSLRNGSTAYLALTPE
jgi:hypothetical protein